MEIKVESLKFGFLQKFMVDYIYLLYYLFIILFIILYIYYINAKFISATKNLEKVKILHSFLLNLITYSALISCVA